MTSFHMMRAGDCALSIVPAGKQSNMATVVSECADVLCGLLLAVQAIEDPSSFPNSCTGLQRFCTPESNGNSPLSSTSTSKISDGYVLCS
jgi:hypothetical protein